VKPQHEQAVVEGRPHLVADADREQLKDLLAESLIAALERERVEAESA
jgi:hypothetical protein